MLHNHPMGMGVNVQGVYALRGAYLWASKAYFRGVHSKRGLSKGGWGAACRGNTELGG